MTIRILSRAVAARIGAGEVIERPVSVVKELVENALDAGASRVQVEIQGGGLSLIRVNDDGEGIPLAELELAFQRYATSKIKDVGDLDQLATLGFRGEALPSIAVVSRVQLTSRGPHDLTGGYVVVEAGAVVEKGRRGWPKGTSVVVRNLFFNVPPRLKFTKSSSTETSHITHLIAQYSLSYPEVKYSLVCDGRLTFHSPGTGKLIDALAAVHGAETAEQMLRVSLTRDSAEEGIGPLRVEGHVSPPTISRPNRHALSFFVNRRWVRSPLLARAVEEAYHTALPSGRSPIGSLNLCLPPAEVDVNVHPAKLEVRFLHEREVYNAIHSAVRQALLRHLSLPALVRASTPVANLGSKLRLLDEYGDALPPGSPFRSTFGARVAREPLLRVLGQLDDSFIVAAGPNGLFLLDQHRVHERVLYERWRRQPMDEVRQLGDGLVVELTPRQAALLAVRMADLHALGLEVECFGARAVVVRAVPQSLFEVTDLIAAVSEVVEEALDDNADDWRDRLLASLCCRQAIKAGQPLSVEEMVDLVHELELTTMPMTCPHANPTIAHLSSQHLARQFGRK